MIFEIESPDSLGLISEYIQKKYPDGIVVLLKGDLGAGKSTFVKNFVKMRNPSATASSPTFSIVHEYDGDIFHYDLYRIGSEEFINRGLAEMLEEKGYHFLEWADEKIEKVLSSYGIDSVTISITQERNKRVFNVQA